MEHEHEIEIEHHTIPTNRRIGIVIAVMATVLAFTEMAARNADTDIVRESVEAADTWAFFQAKSIRAAMYRADARGLQVQAAGKAEADAAQISKTVSDWEAAAAHEDSDPVAKDGRKELAAKAQAIEKHRDERAAAKETYEFASGALELGILLASSAIVTGLTPLAFIGGAFGIIGSGLGLLGWVAPQMVGG
ncbi:MAG TPA: DUF4337 domain-containing protein [Micropepsaceae bacterium]|jgi:hypothetical protein|nr:DUF4337 domain-containing protein [Micropepsaceae bacterium]